MIQPLPDQTAPFGEALRYWRKDKRLSQLALSLQAGISTRHLSFLETGRAQPSRSVILQLVSALDLPLRQCNTLLLAAGYAPEYRHSQLDEAHMEGVRYALEHLIAQNEPYPAMVMDRAYNLVMTTDGYTKTIDYFLGLQGAERYTNPYDLIFDPQGLQPYIDDWNRVATVLLARLREECFLSNDARLNVLLARLEAYPTTPARGMTALPDSETPAPVLDIAFRKDGTHLRFFSMVTTFGTPQDVTVQELRIESLFPANQETRRFYAHPQ